MKNIYKYSLINYMFNMAPFLSTMLTYMLTYLAFYIIIHTIKKVIVLFNKTYNNIINYIEDYLWNYGETTLNNYITRSKLSLEDTMFKLNKQYFGIRNFNDPLSMIQESDYDSLPELINSNLRNSIEASSFATKNSKIKELFFKIIKLLFKF